MEKVENIVVQLNIIEAISNIFCPCCIQKLNDHTFKISSIFHTFAKITYTDVAISEFPHDGSNMKHVGKKYLLQTYQYNGEHDYHICDNIDVLIIHLTTFEQNISNYQFKKREKNAQTNIGARVNNNCIHGKNYVSAKYENNEIFYA